jgi:hypothetical protein
MSAKHHCRETNEEVTMNSIAKSSIVFVLVFGGALCGIFLRTVLPADYFGADTKDIVKLGMALVSTMAALVLGLLIASAKSSYDAQNTAMVESSARIVILDRVLAHYGPETKEARELLRDVVSHIVERTWPEKRTRPPRLVAPSIEGEVLIDKIHELSPKDETQRSLKDQALSNAWVAVHIRWLQYTHQAVSISMPLLVTLVFWLIAIFVSFGLFAPLNAAVVVCMFIAAASVSGAILMILEMYSPYRGLMQLPSSPLQAALSQLGR